MPERLDLSINELNDSDFTVVERSDDYLRLESRQEEFGRRGLTSTEYILRENLPWAKRRRFQGVRDTDTMWKEMGITDPITKLPERSLETSAYIELHIDDHVIAITDSSSDHRVLRIRTKNPRFERDLMLGVVYDFISGEIIEKHVREFTNPYFSAWDLFGYDDYRHTESDMLEMENKPDNKLKIIRRLREPIPDVPETGSITIPLFWLPEYSDLASSTDPRAWSTIDQFMKISLEIPKA